MSRLVLKFNFCAFHHIHDELLKNKINNNPNNIQTIFVNDISLLHTLFLYAYFFTYDIIGYIDFNYVYSKQKQKCSMAEFEFIYVEIK